MTRLPTLALAATALLAAGCAANMGAPEEIPLTTVALRANAGTSPASAATAIRTGGTRVGLLIAPEDAAWFREVADAAGMFLSGPANADTGLGFAFLGLEPLGDTAIDLTYEGGRFTLQDALYELDERRFLDLLAFGVEDADQARPLISALLQYVATDVEPSAAVVMAVAVPNDAVGESVARMLSPGFDDARRCGAAAAPEGVGELWLFYGPEARIFCRSAVVEDTQVGERVRASLIMGRR